MESPSSTNQINDMDNLSSQMRQCDEEMAQIKFERDMQIHETRRRRQKIERMFKV